MQKGGKERRLNMISRLRIGHTLLNNTFQQPETVAVFFFVASMIEKGKNYFQNLDLN